MEYARRLSREVDVCSKLENPFSEKEVTNTVLARVTRTSVDMTFASMANGFFDTAILHLSYIKDNVKDGDCEVLSILHNVFIALELSLKSIYSGFCQFTSEDWMVVRSQIETGHELTGLVGRIRSSYQKSTLKDSEKNWVNDRLKLIERFVEFANNANINFQSTRYPVNRDSKRYEYMTKDISVDTQLLEEWILLLCKACNDLFTIHDFLDDARSSY
ncbi:hypothetical protein [Streptococcus suis]|uniref:Uncharacterized protein n=1 Tax=Streptococcus suis D12 TaxID=1004952 RepID=G7SHE2_STRSU|nr:hypothetical protein [Streptococcus suis]AER19712.1 hypothetical protein SSUD12_1432 [Streptococcus suis D12]MCE6986506.1 hypothetical protein [Streptococcus suis]HEM6504888.1 hypothetical protein [Streptococcus suis]